MAALLQHLERLDRAAAKRRAVRRATWWHRGLLLVAVLLAFVSRAIVPLPGLGAIEGRWIPVALTAAGLLLAGALLLVVTRWVRRGDLHALARRIDDENDWHDETSTAEGLTGAAAETAPARVLVTQGEGRLAQVESPPLGRVASVLGWPRVLLALLFAFLLLAPGVNGLLGLRGAGQGQEDGVGQRAEGVAETAPLQADWFLTVFARDPLPIEMLPEDVEAAASAGSSPAPGEASENESGEGDR